MKKLLFTCFYAAALTLGGCGLESSVSSAQIKANLQNAGYTVEVMGKTEAEGRIQNFKFVVEIVDAVYTEKGENEVLLAFCCKNIADADKLCTENIALLNSFAERYTDKVQVGSHNNVVYTGSAGPVGAAGFPVSNK